MSTLTPYTLFAFYALESRLNNVERTLKLSDFKKKLGLEPNVLERSPIFVTWNILDRHGATQLRGCIGNFNRLQLERGVADYALLAAFDDSRFAPITKAELPRLSVGVTLLQNFEEVDDPLDWELGKHGIRIKFTKNGEEYGATFLPDVAPEQGWDKKQTIQHLVAKAGYRWSKINIEDIQVTRYEGVKSKLTYEEYKDFMKSIEA